MTTHESPLGHFTISGNVTVNSDFYVAGNLTNNGTYDGSGGTLIMTGSNAIHFSTIGSLRSTNAGSSETHYTFTHHGITGPLYYYRIKQLDIDDRFTYSMILIISTNRDVNQMVLLNNTGVGKMGVSIYNRQAGDATIDGSKTVSKFIKP